MLGHARSDRDLDSRPPARKSNGSGRSGGGSGPVRVATEGPYDSEDPAVARLGKTAGRVDFGSLRIPIPARAQLQVEKGNGELLRAVHVLVPSGRVSLSALAAPRSNPLWRGLSGEIADSLSGDGARVRTQWGEWGREVEAGSNGALSRFIGVDGPRWMLYGVATGPADGAVELADVLREMMRKTVVYRGEDPLPVKTVLPLRLPEHLEENVERARDVSAQRPGRDERSGRAGKSGAAGGGGTAPASRSGTAERPGRPTERTDVPGTNGSSAAAPAAPFKSPRRPADPPVRRPGRPPAEAPPMDRRRGTAPQPVTPPDMTPPHMTPPPNGAPRRADQPARHPGRAIGRPAASAQPPSGQPSSGSVPASAQLPPPGPAIGPLGGVGRPVDRRPAGPPPASGFTDPGGLPRQPASGFTDPGGLPRQPVSGYTDPRGLPRQPASAYTDPGGLPRQPASAYTDGGGVPGATPAYGSLPPISGAGGTGGFPSSPGVEGTWSLAMPVVNSAQVSQQPAWALLGAAPSFWPDEQYRPGDPQDGPVEMSSIDSSLPLDSVPTDRGYGTSGPAARDGFDAPSAADDRWRPTEIAPGEQEPSWSGPSDAGSWSTPSDDLLSSTDSLHAVLTHDDAVTRDRQARADRLGRHRSSDT